jgi:hypothetical protein
VNPVDDGLFDDEEPADGEFEISIEPREDALEAAGISPDEFESALMDALEQREEFAIAYDADTDACPELEDTTLRIRGSTYRLGDLADIDVHDAPDGSD